MKSKLFEVNDPYNLVTDAPKDYRWRRSDRYFVLNDTKKVL